MSEAVPEKRATKDINSIEQGAIGAMKRAIAGENTMPELKDVSATALEKLNTEVVYERAGDPEFRDMRHRLQTEAGLLIANHPGGADVFAVAQMVERSDVRILVSSQVYPYLKPIADEYAKEYFIEAAKDAKGATKAFNDMREHVEGGGLVVLFPGGGYRDGVAPPFQDTFRLFVQKVLKPSDMIYAAKIDAGNLAGKGAQISHMAGVMSEGTIGGTFNINKRLPRETVSVDERYTNAGEWKAVVASVEKDDVNTVLTEHFEGLFDEKPEQKRVA